MSSHQLKYPQSCGSVIKLQKKKKVYCATCRKVQPVSSSALLKCPWAAFLCKSNPGWQQDLSEHGFWPDPCFEKHCLSPAFYIFSQLSRRNTLVSVSLPDLYICWPDSNTHTPTHTHLVQVVEAVAPRPAKQLACRMTVPDSLMRYCAWTHPLFFLILIERGWNLGLFDRTFRVCASGGGDGATGRGSVVNTCSCSRPLVDWQM